MHQKCNRKGRESHFPNFQEIFAFFEENLAFSHFGPNSRLKISLFWYDIKVRNFPAFPRELRYNFPLSAGIEKGWKMTTVPITQASFFSNYLFYPSIDKSPNSI